VSRRGFTILELLVVIALIAMLAGLSASAFMSARRNYGIAATAAEVQAILRAARNTSISSGSKSFVVIDPVKREVWAQSFETAGEWSFESEDEGSGVRLLGGEHIEGRIGRGVSFRGTGGYADCGNSPKFDLRAGIVLEAWIRHEMVPAVREPTAKRSSRSKRKKGPKLLGAGKSASDHGRSFVIIERADAFAFELTEYGALIGVVGDYEIITEDDIVAPGRWVFVTMRYDGRKVTLSADGVERGAWPLGGGRRVEVPEEIPRSEAPVTISSGDAPFPGAIDEVRIRGRAEKLVYQHGPELRILGWKRHVHFDRRGHLDASQHDGKVRIVLVELDDDQYQRIDGPEDVKKTSKSGRRKDRSSGLPDFSLTFDDWLGSMSEDYWPEETEAEILWKLENSRYRDVKKVVIEIDRLGVLQ